MLSSAFEKIAKKNPVPVMVRAIAERALSSKQLDERFGETTFQELQGHLNSDINTLGDPKADGFLGSLRGMMIAIPGRKEIIVLS